MIYFILPVNFNPARVNCGVESILLEARRRGLPHQVIEEPDESLLLAPPGALMISFKQYFKGIKKYVGWFKALRKKGWIISIYHIDAPWNNGLSDMRWFLIKNLTWPFDIFFTHSVEQDAPRTKQIIYLPNACGMELTDVTAQTPIVDIGFCGNFNPKNKEHAKRIGLLEQFAQAFEKAGMSFVTQQDDGQPGTWLDHAKRCWLQLSVGSAADRPERMACGLPARVYGFSCIGALTLIEPRKHLPDDFPAPFDLPTFGSVQECVRVANDLLSDKEALNRRRRALMEYSRAHHLYTNRLDKVLEAYGRLGLKM